MLPSFDRLHVFYWIYKEGSVVAAARRLHVTQPAVSQHLRKLEDELEVALFVRMHRRLVATAEADALWAVVEPFVVALDDRVRAIRRGRDAPFGTLRIGAPVEFGQRYLPPICAAFRRAHPEVNFQLELGHPSALLPLLEVGRLDLAFADDFAEAAQRASIFARSTVFTESLVLVGTPALAARLGADGRDPDALAGASFVAYAPRGPSVLAWFRHHHQRAPAKPTIALSVESVRAAIAAVQCELGLAVVPRHVVADALRAGELVELASDTPPLENAIDVVQLQDKIPTLTERVFLEFCRAHLATA